MFSELRKRFEQTSGSDTTGIKALRSDIARAQLNFGYGSAAHDQLAQLQRALDAKVFRSIVFQARTINRELQNAAKSLPLHVRARWNR